MHANKSISCIASAPALASCSRLHCNFHPWQGPSLDESEQQMSAAPHDSEGRQKGILQAKPPLPNKSNLGLEATQISLKTGERCHLHHTQCTSEVCNQVCLLATVAPSKSGLTQSLRSQERVSSATRVLDLIDSSRNSYSTQYTRGWAILWLQYLLIPRSLPSFAAQSSPGALVVMRGSQADLGALRVAIPNLPIPRWFFIGRAGQDKSTA
ncbi:hypothetical protein F5Y15DRAFT_41088 [Xylariaceae sp. FL0016]|nr:hypothetical protein F5Y15DRAFT_41088 [Xylariaceae sp. FL0016]